jgi:hypothetical protein
MQSSTPEHRGFRLSKWYLDCMTPGGDAVVVYAAELGWSRIALRYASVLELEGGRPRVATSLRGHESPVARDGSLAWSSAPLGVRGTWRAIAPPVEETLLDSGDGSVVWRCLQPASRVALHLGAAESGASTRAVDGLGYAEQLTTTIAPWRLPIQELHWGRFVSEPDGDGVHDSLVWIDWRGPHAVRLVLRGGARVDADVSEERIGLADGSALTLDRRDVLREGAIGGTVLGAIPQLRDAVPGRILGVHERKWRSRGVLERPGRRPIEGWAIHEVVRWP